MRSAGGGRASAGRAAGAGSAARRARGFTLIELLIAVTLMAVLAVLGWRGLDSVLKGRERITESSDGLRALSVTFTQLEDDLRRSWSTRLLNAGVPAIGFVVEEQGAPPAMHLLRELPPESGLAQLQRVVWRLRGGVLERGFGGFAMAGPDATAPQLPLTWQPLIGGVSALHVRGWVAGRGWLPSAALVGAGGLAPAQLVITGIEIMIERDNGERVLRVLPVRD